MKRANGYTCNYDGKYSVMYYCTYAKSFTIVIEVLRKYTNSYCVVLELTAISIM